MTLLVIKSRLPHCGVEQAVDGIQRSDDPVSNNTCNFCGGVPISIVV